MKKCFRILGFLWAGAAALCALFALAACSLFQPKEKEPLSPEISYRNWISYTISYAYGEDCPNGEIADDKLQYEVDFAADEDYYLVIDFTATRVYSDWYWEKNFYCAVKIFPAEAVSSSLMEANTGEFTQRIGESAFYNQTSLESIKIPDGVKEIGMCAFQGCSRLKDITIADSVEKIGNQAFYQCTDLRRVELPDKMDTVKMYTFGDCSSLETVILPAGINWVEYQAFSGCSRLSRIYFEGTDEAWKAVNNADPDLARASLYFYSSDEPIGRTYPSSSYWHYGQNHEILIW